MKIYSWNVNSLRNCENHFLNFLSDYSPEIVMIQELRAHPDQISFFLKSVNGYKFIFNDSGKLGYGGTALYYKEGLNVLEASKTLNNKVLDSEGRVIFLRVGDVYLYNFYTPNGNMSQKRLDYKLNYYSNILQLGKRLVKEGKKVVIGGDLNVAHTKLDLWPKRSYMSGYLPQEREWFSNMISAGYIDSFRYFHKKGEHYTWWSLRDKERKENKGWRYDYFLVSKNMEKEMKGAGILKEVFGSDHCPIWVEI